MNRNPSDSDLRDAVTRCVTALEVPRFDAGAIWTQTPARAAAGSVTRITLQRRILVAAPIAIAVVALLLNAPSVIAQVERALHGFAVVNGQTVPLDVRTVTLDEARTQMPFQVIPPAGVPAGLKVTINALSPPSSSADPRLLFQYRANGELPALTIEESSARSRGPTKVMLFATRTVGGQAPLRPPLAAPALPATSGHETYVMRSVEVTRRNGRALTRQYELHPIVWVVRGTRIVLAAPPGSLSAAQLATIRYAMSR